MPLNSDTQIDESALLPAVASTRSKKPATGREPHVLAGKTRIAKPALHASIAAMTKSDPVLKVLRAARGASIDDLTNGRKAQKLVIGSDAARPYFDAGQAAAILRASRWIEQLRDRRVASITELAQREGVPRASISQQLPLSFLAPDIVEAISSGRQPASLTVERLVAVAGASCDWVTLRAALG